MAEVLIHNLIVNRQRGKSNPVEEAKVLDTLMREYNYTLEEAAKQLGISKTWAGRLLKLLKLPPEVQDMVKYGRIPVTGALYIADIEDPNLQIEIAKQGEYFGYTTEQYRARVLHELYGEEEAEELGWKFTEEGAPKKAPILCYLCGNETDETRTYIWLCPACLKILEAFKQEWIKTQETPTTEEVKPTSKQLPETSTEEVTPTSKELPKTSKPESKDWWPY